MATEISGVGSTIGPAMASDGAWFKMREGAARVAAGTSALAAIALTVLVNGAGAQTHGDQPFFPDDFEVSENFGPARIIVTRDSGAGQVSVRYETKSSDAREGADYSPARGELTFGEGETEKSFQIDVVNDSEPEEDESVLLVLYSSAGTAIDASELVIHSDEGIPADPDDGPGAGSSGSDPANPGANASGRGAAGRGAAGQGPNASGGGGAAVAGDIPTILLEPSGGEGSSRATTRNGEGRGLASRPAELSGPKKVIWAISALALSAAIATLLWLRIKGNRTPEPPRS